MSPHRYGPHDPGTAPTSVTVGRPGPWPAPREEVRPLHPALVRQRRLLNDRAHRAAADLEDPATNGGTNHE